MYPRVLRELADVIANPRAQCLNRKKYWMLSFTSPYWDQYRSISSYQHRQWVGVSTSLASLQIEMERRPSGRSCTWFRAVTNIVFVGRWLDWWQPSEKDLAMLIDEKFSVSSQFALVVQKVNHILGSIKVSMVSREWFLPCALVWPHLEYCVQLWGSYYKTWTCWEWVQLTAIKRIRAAASLLWGKAERDGVVQAWKRKGCRENLQ